MKTIYVKLLFIFIMIFFIGYFQYEDHVNEHIENKEIKQQSKENIVTVKTKEKTLKIKIDDYLVGVLAGEMPAEFESEALKAQAVASRTFVLSRNLSVDNTTNSQVYLNDEEMKDKWGKDYQKFKQKIIKAIQDTHNEVMTYKGEYISAMFFSSSNGKTVNCEDYFTGEVAYLKAVDSHWDLTIDSTNKREKTFSKKELSQIFDVNISKLSITSYTSSGYVKKVIINNKEYTGREVREKLGLASSSFKIKMTKTGYTFTTRGNGHGVGMSQYGAQAMAKGKKTYDEILHYYYKNIKIERI